MFGKIKDFIKPVLRFLYTNKCIICNQNSEDYICKNCKKEINFLSLFPTKIYKKTPIYCASVYKTVIKKLIKSLKFYRKKYAYIPLAQILFDYYVKLKLKKDFVIVFPPTFFSKNTRRGYCHMELIAKEFARLTNFKLEKKLIKKTKYTKPQYTSKNRKKNIENSYIVNKKLIQKYKNSPILILDDITTSGATIETLVDILISAGIEDITSLVIAKAGK